MKPHENPIVEYLAGVYRLSDEYRRLADVALSLACRFEQTSTDDTSTRGQLLAEARKRLRRLHANAEHMTALLARFERHLPTVPLYWHSTIRRHIKVGMRGVAIARRAAITVRAGSAPCRQAAASDAALGVSSPAPSARPASPPASGRRYGRAAWR